WSSDVCSSDLAGSGAVVDADPVAHVAHAAGRGGKILGPMFHRARRHVAGEDGDAAVDLEQDLAGVEAVVLGQPVDDVVGDAGVGALCPEPRTAGVNYR